MSLAVLLQLTFVYSQTSPQVEPPYFKGTSIDLTNQRVTLFWELSKTSSSLVSGYTIYERIKDVNQNPVTNAVASVTNTVSTYSRTISQYTESHKYTLRSHGFGGSNTDSPQTDYLNTLFLNPPDFQECNSTIRLQWSKVEKFDKFKPENTITNFTAHYAVWYAVNVPEEALTLADFQLAKNQLANTEYTFTVTPSVRQYHFFIRAYYDNGNGSIDSSQSNRITQVMDAERLPEYFKIDSAIHLPTQTQLYFQIDPQTTYRNFEIQYSIGSNDFRVLKTIENLTDSKFEDHHPLPVSYRIVMKNKCDMIVSQSNTVTLISPVIKAFPEGFSIHVSPNICPDNGLFDIYRISPYPAQLASGITDTIYIDPLNNGQYQDYIFKSNYNVICSNADNVMVSIRNNDIAVEPEFYMPDALRVDDSQTNSSTGKVRGIFEPITPVKYTFRLTIYDTQGNLYFDGHEGWNGRKNNTGSIVTEGVYFYAIQVTFSNGEIRHKKGSVTVLY